MTQKAGQLCPSRRKLLLSAAWTAALAGGGMFFGSEAGQAQQKASKEQVQYQDSPKDGKKCSDCIFFVEPNACKTVVGDISPDGWCQLWTKAP